jgi:hypothetical protein
MSDDQVEAAGAVIEEITARAAAIDPTESRVRHELERKLHDWEARQPALYWNDRRSKQSLLQSAERAAALRTLGRGIGEAWATMNNMRSVEPSVRFRLAERLRSRAEDLDGEQETTE